MRIESNFSFTQKGSFNKRRERFEFNLQRLMDGDCIFQSFF